VNDALTQIALVCDRLGEQFGVQDALARVDGNYKVLLRPTLNVASVWVPPEGRPFPVIEPSTLLALDYAARRLLVRLPVPTNPDDTPQETEDTPERRPDPVRALGRSFADLSKSEKRIVKTVQRESMKGERLAAQVGLSFNYARRLFAQLVSEGFFTNNDDGYRANSDLLP
jgi:hypothetical protein